MTLADYADEIPEDLPPSALFVLWALMYYGSMTTAELHDKTMLKTGTIRDATRRLRDRGLAETNPGIVDPRKKRHVATLGR